MLNIQSLFGGRETLFLNPALLEKQLTPELGEQTAIETTAIVLGMEKTLIANPVIESFVVEQSAVGIAASFAHMRRILTKLSTDAEVPEDKRARASALLAKIDVIVTAGQTELPVEANDPAQGPINTDEILNELGVNAR